MSKYKVLGASIIISTFIICSFLWKWYNSERLLLINSVSQQLVIEEALQLGYEKAILKMIENGQIDELSKSLKNHIEIKEYDVSSQANRYKFNERQREIIENSLRNLDTD